MTVGALALALGSVSSGCGDGDGAAPPATTTTTAVPPRPPELAVIRVSDLGDPWAVHDEASGYVDVRPASCLRQGAALDAMVEDGYFDGATLRRGHDVAYAETVAIEFEDASSAEAFIDHLRSQEYQECRTRRLSEEVAAADGAAAGSRYRLREVADAAGEGEEGFELQLSYQYQADVEGQVQDANGYVEDMVFRAGALVTLTTISLQVTEDSPDDLFEQVFKDVSTAIATGLERASSYDD